MSEAVVVSALRTAVTKAKKGAFKDTRPDDLLAEIMRGALAQVPQLDPVEKAITIEIIKRIKGKSI